VRRALFAIRSVCLRIHEEIDHSDASFAGIARSDFGGESCARPGLLIDAEQQANVFHADAGPFQFDVDFVVYVTLIENQPDPVADNRPVVEELLTVNFAFVQPQSSYCPLSSMHFFHRLTKTPLALVLVAVFANSHSSGMSASALSRSILRASRKASHRSSAVHSLTGLLLLVFCA
jgi:hypothetical protein